jgi:hypothetical protein
MSNYLSVIGVLTFGSAACSASAPAPPRESGRIVTSLSEIAGAWDIASFGGYTPVRLHEGIRRSYVDIGPRGLSYVIECNYSGNPARIGRDGVLYDESDGSRLSTLVGCGPVGEAREGAFFSFFGSRPKVTWIDARRIRMSNGRTELILERPEVRRLANVPRLKEIAGRWIPQMATRIMNNNGYSGSGFQEPGVVTVAGNSLTYTGCGGLRFSFTYTHEGQIRTQGEAAPSACGGDGPGSMLVLVVENDPLVERIAGGGLALTAGSEVITLRSEQRLRRQLENPPPPSAGYVGPPPPPTKPKPTRR